jgi:DNA-3-methyladenine glycosylase I
MDGKTRCGWCTGKDYYEKYHDEEWGVPVRDDRTHFEFLILEGAQAGLSWDTILKKRDGYRRAFKNFEPSAVAAMTDEELEALLHNPEIIRNRLKVFGARKNAVAFLKIQEEFGSFDAYVWRFVGGKPIQNRRKSLSEVPASTPESDALAKDLKKRGMTFVGTTIIYAHMQATGLVNDHVENCFRHKDLS